MSMKLSDKLLVQTMICLAIFTAFRGLELISADSYESAREKLDGYLGKNYTLAELKTGGSELLDSVRSAPAALAGAVTRANELGRFGAPIDEKDTGGTQAVHAVAGGTVVYAGIDSEHGLMIRVQHEEEVSSYGNLASISAITGERVTKGEIIGTYEKKEGQEFYYQLSDNVL